jgi:hypothetical protein
MPSIGAILAGGALVVALVWWIVLKVMGVGTPGGDGSVDESGSYASGSDDGGGGGDGGGH